MKKRAVLFTTIVAFLSSFSPLAFAQKVDPNCIKKSYDVCNSSDVVCLNSLSIRISSLSPTAIHPGYQVRILGSNLNIVPDLYVGLRAFRTVNGKYVGSDWVYVKNFQNTGQAIDFTAPANLPTGDGMVALFYGEATCQQSLTSGIQNITRTTVATKRGNLTFATSAAGSQQTPPRAPRSLTPLVFSRSRIDFTFENVEREDGYRIQFLPAGGGRIISVDVPFPDRPVASVINLAPGTRYAFSVLAYNSAGVSPPFGPVEATTLDRSQEEGWARITFEPAGGGGNPPLSLPSGSNVLTALPSTAAAFYDTGSDGEIDGALKDGNLNGAYPRHAVELHTEPGVPVIKIGNSFWSDPSGTNKANIAALFEIPPTNGAALDSGGRRSPQFITIHFHTPDGQQISPKYVAGGDLNLNGRMMTADNQKQLNVRGTVTSLRLPALRNGVYQPGRLQGEVFVENLRHESSKDSNSPYALNARIEFNLPLFTDDGQ